MLGIMQARHKAGVKGADLCVRPAHPVTPENVETELPPAAGLFHAEELSIPMITVPTHQLDEVLLVKLNLLQTAQR